MCVCVCNTLYNELTTNTVITMAMAGWLGGPYAPMHILIYAETRKNVGKRAESHDIGAELGCGFPEEFVPHVLLFAE